MSEYFPFCEKLPSFKPYHVYAAVTSKFPCWTLRFSVHWRAQPVPSLTADHPAGEQSKRRWICHALVRDRRRDRSGGVKQVGGKAGRSVPKKACRILHPLERSPWLLSISQDLGVLCCQRWQPDSPSLIWHVPTQQSRKNNPNFALDQLPNPAPHEVMSVCGISKEAGVRDEEGRASLRVDVLQNLLAASVPKPCQQFTLFFLRLINTKAKDCYSCKLLFAQIKEVCKAGL